MAGEWLHSGQFPLLDIERVFAKFAVILWHIWKGRSHCVFDNCELLLLLLLEELNLTLMKRVCSNLSCAVVFGIALLNSKLHQIKAESSSTEVQTVPPATELDATPMDSTNASYRNSDAPYLHLADSTLNAVGAVNSRISFNIRSAPRRIPPQPGQVKLNCDGAKDFPLKRTETVLSLKLVLN